MEWLGRYPNQQDREIDRLEERLQAAILVLKSDLARMAELVKCDRGWDCRSGQHIAGCVVAKAYEILQRAEVAK